MSVCILNSVCILYPVCSLYFVLTGSCICKNQKETRFPHRMRVRTIEMINQIKLVIIGRFLNLFIYFLCWKKIWEIVPEEKIVYATKYGNNKWIFWPFTYQNVVMILDIDLEHWMIKHVSMYGVVSCILFHFFLLISSVLLEWLAKV